MTYPSKTLVKNITHVPRSLSEATRDAQYCCAIQTFKTDFKLTVDFVIHAVMGFVITLAIASPFAIGFWMWSKL